MKFFVFSSLLLSSSFVMAQLHLAPVDKNIDLKQVPEGVVIDRPVPRGQSLTPTKRDQILNRLFGKTIANFDDVDRDILYKSILHYPKEKLLRKYPFIEARNYQKVKDAFQ